MASETTLKVLAAVATVAAIGDGASALSIHVTPETLRTVAADLGKEVRDIGISRSGYRVLQLRFAQGGADVDLLASEPVAPAEVVAHG